MCRKGSGRIHASSRVPWPSRARGASPPPSLAVRRAQKQLSSGCSCPLPGNKARMADEALSAAARSLDALGGEHTPGRHQSRTHRGRVGTCSSAECAQEFSCRSDGDTSRFACRGAGDASRLICPWCTRLVSAQDFISPSCVADHSTAGAQEQHIHDYHRGYRKIATQLRASI